MMGKARLCVIEAVLVLVRVLVLGWCWCWCCLVCTRPNSSHARYYPRPRIRFTYLPLSGFDAILSFPMLVCVGHLCSVFRL